MKTCVKLAASAVVTTMLMFASFPANAASPAESLEKGIYNEETTGNLDEAIKHYRQVLSDAQKTEGLAAQAQYRLGRCLDKQGKKLTVTDSGVAGCIGIRRRKRK
ncbi:MAG: tetratricopeptide (TPR) repeat protein [Porticoccaceae bacterium]|jgi:tetratricopeptide (TPR) repeat protein